MFGLVESKIIKLDSHTCKQMKSFILPRNDGTKKPPDMLAAFLVTPQGIEP